MVRIFPEPRRLVYLGVGCSISEEPVVRIGEASLPPQGFRLHIDPSGIRIDAHDACGAYYAQCLLEQIIEANEGDDLDGLCLEDWPDFKDRAYLLDISRDRVPTMAHLYRLVDTLARLRYNQLQLYTEHTFAYTGHGQVWKEASPMTAAEIRQLDTYCRKRFIELVPNQNSFGHMERWLKHDAYKHLAECPEGFKHPISGEWRAQGSVLKPDLQSLNFLDGLYAELLQNFSSRRLNLGGDEPWELGWGASRERVEREGKQTVYLDFLKAICQLAERHGVQPMCWADVLLEDANAIEQLPPGVIPVLWGYEADHPFAEQCSRLAKLGRAFYVAPGDSTWNSLTGRYRMMLDNVKSAAENGVRYGASGLMMTHWGDEGHPQAWLVSLPALAWAGLLAWRADSSEATLEAVLEVLLSGRAAVAPQVLLEVAGLDDTLAVNLLNRSYLRHSLRLNAENLDVFRPRPSNERLVALIEACNRLSGMLDDSSEPSPETMELALSVRLNRFAAYRCLGRMEDCPDCLDRLAADYCDLWMQRSRPGGLKDSLNKLLPRNI